MSGESPRSLRRLVLKRALVRGPLGIAIFFVLVFLPAGTLDYWQAWAYFAMFVCFSTAVGSWLMLHDPALLERRLRVREKERTQRWVIAAGTFTGVFAYVAPGLDRRFGWSQLHPAAVLAADVVCAAALIWFFLVLRENRWASRVVEVAENQRVIDSGPYAVVRHPMYLCTFVLYSITPLALGALWAVPIAALVMAPVLYYRIANEEEVLLRDLPGYADYRRRVHYRMLPGVW